MLASFYLLSEGWATATYSPFYILFRLSYFLLIWLSLLQRYLFLLVFVFLFVKSCILFHPFHKCCKLNWNLPWEDRDDSDAQAEPVLGLKQMLIPISAGILSALRRVIARRVSIKVVMFM